MFAEGDHERKTKLPRKKKIEKELAEEQKPSESDELTEEETYQLVSLFNSAGGGNSKPRIISLYVEIDEDQC